MGGRDAGRSGESEMDQGPHQGVQDGQAESGSLGDPAQDGHGGMPGTSGAGIHGVQEDGSRPLLREPERGRTHQTPVRGRGASGLGGEQHTSDGHFWAQFQDWCGHVGVQGRCHGRGGEGAG